MTTDRVESVDRKALSICFLAAIIEGFDIQAAGVAAPKLGPAFNLTPGQLGLFFSAATFGLIFGALIGGWIADRFGRRSGLALSLALFGAFSIAITFATSFELLITARFLTGIGLGGALPNLIAIAAEAAPPEKRGSTVSVMYAGIPLGGAAAALVSLAGLADAWQLIFLVGGVLPLLLIPVVYATLPPLKVTARSSDRNTRNWREVLGGSRLTTTLLLWCGFFFGLLVMYLLLNWLPALLVSRGFDRTEAILVQIAFNIAGALGSLVGGRAVDGSHPRAAVTSCFVFLMAALLALALLPTHLAAALACGAVVGAGIISVQAVLYGLAPQCYPAEMRGTGVGLAVAAGRLGSVAGPLLAGALVAAGGNSSQVLIALVPLALFGGIASVLLVARTKARTPLHAHQADQARFQVG